MFRYIKRYFNYRRRLKLYPILTKMAIELKNSSSYVTSFYYYKELLESLQKKFKPFYKANLNEYPHLNQVDYDIEQAMFFCGLLDTYIRNLTSTDTWNKVSDEDKDKITDYLITSKNFAIDAVTELTEVMQKMLKYKN